ncbi:MAG: endonuclease III [Candidatus Uhrbacteria bacterium]
MTDIERILRTLKRRFPNPGAMELGDPYRTVVGVVLSARTRDEQVLKLLPGLFEAFPTMGALSKAAVAEIAAKINTIGMYRQKAKNLSGLAKRCVEVHGGLVPSTMDELVDLPGVGRKTASVVVASCFGTPSIAVDTHVHRVTNRLGWVKTKTPQKTEVALLRIVPTKVMRLVNQVFVKIGRYVCIPGKPRCWMCPVQKDCAFKKKNLVAPKDADAIVADIARREHDLEKQRLAVAYGKHRS